MEYDSFSLRILRSKCLEIRTNSVRRKRSVDEFLPNVFSVSGWYVMHNVVIMRTSPKQTNSEKQIGRKIVMNNNKCVSSFRCKKTVIYK